MDVPGVRAFFATNCAMVASDMRLVTDVTIEATSVLAASGGVEPAGASGRSRCESSETSISGDSRPAAPARLRSIGSTRSGSRSLTACTMPWSSRSNAVVRCATVRPVSAARASSVAMSCASFSESAAASRSARIVSSFNSNASPCRQLAMT